MPIFTSIVHRLCIAIRLLAAVGAWAATVNGQEAAGYDFDIPAGTLGVAIQVFTKQSDAEVVAPTDLIDGLRTKGAHGRMTPAQALDALLQDTKLRAVPDSGGAFALVPRPSMPSAGKARNAAAVIVVGLSADEAQAGRLWHEAETARAGLLARGVSAERIIVVPSNRGEKASRDQVLAALHAVPATTAETWVILFGSSRAARDGRTAFQVSGPRLGSIDLASAIAALPGTRFVVLATSQSGGFLPPLAALPNVEAVAATAAAGEFNEPRFAGIWAEELTRAPDAEFRTLAQAAARRTLAYYADGQVAESEHAQVIDRPSRRIIELSSAYLSSSLPP